MNKYRISPYRLEIEKVEIEKETDKTLWVKEKNSHGKEYISQCRKDSSWHKYFDTFEDAKQYLIEKNIKEFENLNEKIENNRKEYSEIKKLTEEI